MNKKLHTGKIKVPAWLIGAMLTFFLADVCIAQCTGGSSGGALSPAPSASYQTMAVAAGDKYYTFVVAAAACMPTYDFSFCATEGGSASFDTQITILDNSGVYANGFNDDFCGLQSHLTWTPSAAGTYRIHINKYSCVATTASATLAYKVTTAPVMTYVSSTTAQASTATILKCDVNQPLLQVQVVTGGGTCTPLTLTQLQIAMAGTSPTTDVSLIHVYYTGTSSTFSATNAFDGAGTTPAAGTITINGSQALSLGTNYFWVAYDMNLSGTTGNTVDALCLASPATTLTAGGTARTVTANNPAGTRSIVVCPVSPGAIGSGLSFWLKAGTGTTTSGGNLTGWTDQSPAPVAVTVNGSPDYTSPGYNYNPYINFTLSSATGGDYLHVPDAYWQSFFWVAKLNDLTRKSTHLATYDGVTLSAPCALCAVHGGENGTSAAEYGEFTYGQGNFQTAGVWRKNGTSSGITYATPHSGSFDIVTALGTGTGAVNSFMGGQNSNLPTFDGRTRDWVGPVGEIIAYSGSVSASQANKIESYLALKYGITLGGNGSTTLAYTSPSGTTIWTANTGYHYDVAGIGKDVATEALDQPKSHSINSPSDLVTLANSNFASPTSLTNNGDYLIVGHNNGSLTSPVTSNFTHNGPVTSLQVQLSRVWRSQKTGTPAGNLILEFDMSLVSGPTGTGTNANADIRLMVDDDANFSNASAGEHTYSPTAGYSTSGGKIYFSVPYSDIQTGTGFFTLGSVNKTTATLPMELKDFSASCENEEVNISWATASETNNDFFTIERSGDGLDFTPLANIKGSGTSSVAQTYQYTDHFPLTDQNYYRLKQTDYNGNFRYCTVIESSCASGGNEQLISFAYPNPAGNFINVDLSTARSSEISIRLYDVIGNLIIDGEKLIERGKATIRLNLEGLPRGLYSLQVRDRNSGYSSLTKVVKE
ncbi:MAG: T9SS type A sorting domain-containing protein [Bacteroidia bacterium]